MTNQDWDKYCQSVANSMPDPVLLSDRKLKLLEAPMDEKELFELHVKSVNEFIENYKELENAYNTLYPTNNIHGRPVFSIHYLQAIRLKRKLSGKRICNI